TDEEPSPVPRSAHNRGRHPVLPDRRDASVAAQCAPRLAWLCDEGYESVRHRGELAPPMQDATPGSKPAERRARRTFGSRLANVALALVSLIVSVLAVEIGYRLATGLPLLEFANWRGDHTIVLESGDLPVPDPLLGWVSRPGYTSDDYNTLAHGI